jgi:hypothetical protein
MFSFYHRLFICYFYFKDITFKEKNFLFLFGISLNKNNFDAEIIILSPYFLIFMRNTASVKGIFSLLSAFILVFSSCKKDKDNYTIPTSYNFENVDYSGQTSRIGMLSELGTYAKSGNALNSPLLNAQKMKDMFNNSYNPFADTTLNNSGKKLADKTVSSEAFIFEQLMDSLAAVSAFSSNGSPSLGNPGVMTNSSGTKAYLVNGNGVELAQLIEKGLMGTCFYYQATAVYLGEGKMNVDNTTVTPGVGTTMEHHWDEAFGYLGVAKDFPANLTGLKFWGKYLNDRESKLGLNATLMNAFLAGRAAISNDNLGERDVKITSIRRSWELVVAGTAVAYLNDALAAYGNDDAEKHHALSEAYAFIYSLKWGGNATITSSSVDAILTLLGGSSNLLNINFYGISNAQIQNAKDALVNNFSSLAAVKDSL